MSAMDLSEAYRAIYTIRRFEERARDLRQRGDIVCSVHLCLGHEAVAVGARTALAEHDVVFATYRGHHWALACGTSLEELFAEFLGRESGVNGGRSGAGLFLDPKHNFLGENGIVGAGAPLAVGTALAARYDESGRVSLVAFGDGAINQGAVHEAMNFAAVYDLAVVFVCENNGYAEYTRSEDMLPIEQLADRAQAYGFPGEVVDGTSPELVHEAVARAAARAREGAGPTLIEARVRRLAGHHTHDPEHYRPEGERETWLSASDPLVRVRTELAEGGTSEQVLAAIEQEAEASLEAALERAQAAPVADPATVLEHVYG
jgi:pyruvate dehydrogenase E1 component alpha subunit